MLHPGQILTLEIEKPAAGGRMIARAEGQIVFVAGAIPGERASVRVERVGKGTAYAQVVAIDVASPDRRQPVGDPLCGGCLYSGIAYSRQLQLKAEVVADALRRIGRHPWNAPIEVVASPEHGYRLRARLHYRRQRLGWFLQNTHEVCDLRAGRQLLDASCEVLDRLAAGLQRLGVDDDLEIELSENVAATERAVHLEGARVPDPTVVQPLAEDAGVTGFSVAEQQSPGISRAAVVSGDPRVHDHLTIQGTDVSISRHVLAFFQGNRFLIEPLVSQVLDAVEAHSTVFDLYAGGGLFALSAAVVKRARVVAVEGDRVAAADLAFNAAGTEGAIEIVAQSVEQFVGRRRPRPDVVVVDPPRTGLSKEAIQGVIALGAPRLVYVSCDVATGARDTRVLVDAGYRLASLRAFDLFPNTPHVETVARFER